MGDQQQTYWKYGVGVLLAAALLAWLFRSIDFDALRDAIVGVSILGMVACALLQFAHNLFRIARWRVLLQPIRGSISIYSMFISIVMGYAVTFVIPGRFGEFVRPAILSGRESLPVAPTLGTVVVDRLFDAGAIVVLFLVGLLTTPMQGRAAEYSDQIRSASIAILPVVLAATIGLMLVSRAHDRVEGWLVSRGVVLRRLGGIVLGVARGSQALARPKAVFVIVLHSLAAWSLIAFGIWVGLRACGAILPLGGAFLLLPAIALGVALPTPGGAGGYHAAISVGLMTLFSTPEPIALAAAILGHLAVLAPVLLTAAGLILAGAMPFSDLKNTLAQVRSAGRGELGGVAT